MLHTMWPFNEADIYFNGCSSVPRKIFFLTNLNRLKQSFEECSCETLLISLNWLISVTERRTPWRFWSTRQIQGDTRR
jgi:hypothetical protein